MTIFFYCAWEGCGKRYELPVTLQRHCLACKSASSTNTNDTDNNKNNDNNNNNNNNYHNNDTSFFNTNTCCFVDFNNT